MSAFKDSMFVLSPNIDYLDKQIETIINQLSIIYYTCCMPRVITDTKGRMKDVCYHFISDEARDNYDKLQSILAMLLKEKAKSLLGEQHV